MTSSIPVKLTTGYCLVDLAGNPIILAGLGCALRSRIAEAAANGMGVFKTQAGPLHLDEVSCRYSHTGALTALTIKVW